MSDNQRQSCICVKSNCVMLYCSCFRTYSFCSDNCRCTDCQNYQSNEDSVEERMDMVKMKYPRSGPKIVRVQDAMEIDSQSSNAVLEDEQLMNANGCSCRKSKCLHLKCRCFKHKVRCTAICRCIECSNGPIENSDSNTGTNQSDASGLTYEEPTTENPNKRQKKS